MGTRNIHQLPPAKVQPLDNQTTPIIREIRAQQVKQEKPKNPKR